jgi:hypothetical protein
VRLQPLTRLRVAFVALGVVVLTPLGFLLNAFNERLEAQRRLRHEVVAERIFDELERELTVLLESESARPSSAYDEATRAETWESFVVGYFKRSAKGTELLARDQLDSSRVARLTFALDASRDPRRGADGAGGPEESSGDNPRSQYMPQSSPDVLRKLNRSLEERERPTKGSRSAPGSSEPAQQRY